MPSARRQLAFALLTALFCTPAAGHWPIAWSLGRAVEEALPPSRWTFDSFLARVDRAEEPAELVDSYLEARRRIPVAEKTGRIHFLYRGEAADVRITGPMLADPEEPESLRRIEGTDLFFRSYDYDPAGVWRYRFIVDGAAAAPDPLNPRRALSVDEWSEVTMPDWREPSFLRARDGVPAGHWQSLTVESASLGRVLEIEVYLPAEYFGPLEEDEERPRRRRRRQKAEEGEQEAEPGEGEAPEGPLVAEGWDKRFPVILIAGGPHWREFGQLHNVLDNLFHLRVEPSIVALLPASDGEGEQPGGLAAYAELVETDVIPALDGELRTLAEPARRAIVGVGPDGAVALHVGLRGGGAVAGVAALSPPSGALAGLAGKEVGAVGKAYLAWSRYEPRSAEGGDTRSAAAVLLGRLREGGFATAGGEVAAGPGWRSWRAQAGEMLRHLFPQPPPLPELLTRRAFEGVRGTLVLSVDAPSELAVDGGDPVELQPGETHEEEVEAGERKIVAKSLEAAKAVWSESVEVVDPNSAVEVQVPMARTLRALRRTERGEGLYRDTDTGLIWTRADNGRDVTWEDAEAYCAESGFAGANDWRLPTIAELKTLQAIWSRATYKTIAKIKPSACCSWSSEPEGDSRAWSFNFRHRRAVLSHRSYSLDLRALCVRPLTIPPAE